MTHPLDRPAWSALSSRQASLSLGDDRARRFAPEYGPLAAAADGSPEALAALAALNAGGGLILVEAEPPPIPPGVEVRRQAVLHQMVLTALTPGEPAVEITPLGESDAAEIFALARLTEPGPFAEATHRLGGFGGVRREGRLVAMAGQRMRPEGFTEVSAVCTHPDHRGRGYAAGLIRHVAGRIVAAGETAFLHAYAHNTRAIALYESLGFTLRRSMTMTVLA